MRTLQYGYTVDIKLSFFPYLYQLIGEHTTTGNLEQAVLLSNMSNETLDAIRVDESVPYPTIGKYARTDYCVDEDDCNCTYFVVFSITRGATEMPLTTPAHNLYMNRFQEPNCICYLSRATPITESTIIFNPFGMCFDQNCLSSAVDLSGLNLDCAGAQCDVARNQLSGANWENNIINPGAINLQQVESLCNMKVSNISADTNRWQLNPIVLTGGIILTLATPIYVGCQAWIKQSYTFSFWHIVLTVLGLGIGILVNYALVGIYSCQDSNTLRQAKCYDRLTGMLPLSNACCDTKDPLFCQCDPGVWDQKICRSAIATGFCKCQGNGLCVASSGNTGILSEKNEQQYAFNYHYLFLFICLFALVTPLITLGIEPFLRLMGTTNWMINVTYHLCTILLCAVCIIGFPLLLTYLYIPEETATVDVDSQNLVCSVSDSS